MNRISFHEFEAYTESVKDADMRCMLPRLELPIWSMQNLSIEKIHLQFASEGCGNIAEGATRPDGCILFVPLSGKPGRGNGTLMNQDAPLLLGPKTEFRICFEHAHDWFSLFVPEELLNPTGSCERGASSRLPKSGRVIRPSAALLGRLRYMVDRLISAAEVAPAIFNEPASLVEIRDDLSGVFREIIGITNDPETPSIGRPAVVREQVIRTVLAQVNDLEAVPTVEDLVIATKVSERTLRSIFCEVFGMPPLRYLRLRRLHQSRKSLSNVSSPETTVAAIAAKYGFWDFGRFARDYRHVFGELPSQTLRRGGQAFVCHPSSRHNLLPRSG
jgi:AraC family ethanolamine operon transcriptional activator